MLGQGVTAGVGASAMMVSVGAGRERLADMKRVVDQPTRGGAGDCFAQLGRNSWRRIEKGYFGNFTKYRFGYLLTKPQRGSALEEAV